MLSRDRCTVITAISSSSDVQSPPLEFVFKGKGKRVHINPPPNVKVQWAEKALEHVLEYVKRLPSIPAAFQPCRRVIFTLDDYSAHLSPIVESELLKKGCFLILIGGGITGDFQVNDTTYHRPSKSAYRQGESQLMLEKLRENPEKIPQPSRDEMVTMFQRAWDETIESTSNVHAFKQNLMTLAFDGSEDHLDKPQLMDLVGEEMKAFRVELLKSKPVANLSALRKLMIPPEGVKHGKSLVAKDIDEGLELFDGDGEGLSDDKSLDSDDDNHEEMDSATVEPGTAEANAGAADPTISKQ